MTTTLFKLMIGSLSRTPFSNQRRKPGDFTACLEKSYMVYLSHQKAIRDTSIIAEEKVNKLLTEARNVEAILSGTFITACQTAILTKQRAGVFANAGMLVTGKVVSSPRLLKNPDAEDEAAEVDVEDNIIIKEGDIAEFYKQESLNEEE